MTPLLKGLISLVTAGVVIGGGILIKNNLLSKEERLSVSKRLEKEGYTILNTSVDSEWNTTLEKHKSNQISYPKFTLTSQELKPLQEACKAILNKTDESEDDYKKAKKWCVKLVSIKGLIQAKSLNLLDVDQTGEENKNKWKPLADEYVTKGKGNNQIGDLILPATVSSTEDDWKKLRTKCKEAVAKDFWSDKYEEELNKAIMWCTLRPNNAI